MSETREQLVRECFSNLFMIKRLLSFQFSHEHKSLGLSPSQIELLYIVKHKQSPSLKKLAFIMQLTPGAVTQLVEGLVQDGILQREHDLNDRRVQLISLTKSGETKMTEVQRINEQRAHQISEILTDEELKAMSTIQKKIVDNLRINLERTKEGIEE